MGKTTASTVMGWKLALHAKEAEKAEGIGMLDYKEMRRIMVERAEGAGFPIGSAVAFRGRPGVIVDVNPFFFDMDPLKVVVHLSATEKSKERLRENISVGDLKPLPS